jgi:hypothetical protein
MTRRSDNQKKDLYVGTIEVLKDGPIGGRSRVYVYYNYLIPANSKEEAKKELVRHNIYHSSKNLDLKLLEKGKEEVSLELRAEIIKEFLGGNNYTSKFGGYWEG